MSRKSKLIDKLLGEPKDFSYRELVSLLRHFGYYELKKGMTSGSRRAFVNQKTMHILRLHKPHPQNYLKPYQMKEVVNELRKFGYI